MVGVGASRSDEHPVTPENVLHVAKSGRTEKIDLRNGFELAQSQFRYIYVVAEFNQRLFIDDPEYGKSSQ